MTTFLYFTAFVAELAEFAEMEPDNDFSQTWIDAQVAAGVRTIINLNLSAAQSAKWEILLIISPIDLKQFQSSNQFI